MLASTIVPLGELAAVELHVRLPRGVRPSDIQDRVAEGVSVTLRSPPEVDIEQIDVHGVMARIAVRPEAKTDGPQLADEIVEAIDGLIVDKDRGHDSTASRAGPTLYPSAGSPSPVQSSPGHPFELRAPRFVIDQLGQLAEETTDSIIALTEHQPPPTERVPGHWLTAWADPRPPPEEGGTVWRRLAEAGHRYAAGGVLSSTKPSWLRIS